MKNPGFGQQDLDERNLVRKHCVVGICHSHPDETVPLETCIGPLIMTWDSGIEIFIYLAL
jgi:hypothetical protein